MDKPYFNQPKPERQAGHRVFLQSTDYEEDTVLKLSEFPPGTHSVELCIYSGYDEGGTASVDVTFIGYTPFTPEEEVQVAYQHTVYLEAYERRLAAYQLELARYETYLQKEQDKTERQQYETLKKKFEIQ